MKTIQKSSAICATLAVIAGLFTLSVHSRTNPAQAAIPQLPMAPELVGSGAQWLNTDGKALTLNSRRGKVTIIEFFAFQCSNCKANLPTYKKWATKWEKQGVEVIAVHTPELPAERDQKNVASYARDNGISFPILIDSTGANWKNWKQQYWPTIYVVGADGRVRYQWQGELEYNNAGGTAQVERQIEAAIADTTKPKKIFKTEAEWQRILPPMTFEVLRHAETENAYSGDLWDNHEAGIYRCAGCGLELFSSTTKFESGTGWPSFYQALNRNAVEEKSDYTMGMERTEVVCARCGGHLGHVFNDGPRPTGLRYCMNSAALSFQKAQRVKRLEPKHPLAIRWFHWINFPVLFVMIWSGLLVYWANDVYRIGIGKYTLLHFFPEQVYERFHLSSRLAEGMAWHFTFAWIFALNGLLYVLFVAFSGEWRYLLPTRKSFAEAFQVVLHDLKIRKSPLPRAKFNGAQRFAYTGVVVMGFGSLVTGLAIYKPIQLAIISRVLSLPFLGATGYEVARWLHFWLTIGFCGFFLIHVAQVMRAGWNNFRAMITGFEVVTEEQSEPSHVS